MSFLSLWMVLKRSKKRIYNGIPFYKVDNEKLSGANFFKHILIGAHHIDAPYFEIILKHEEMHARSCHSLDIIIGEIYRALFWVNPIAWFINHSIRINTEYDADHQMVQVLDKSMYAKLLIRLSSKSSAHLLYNSFSAFNVKSRLKQIYYKKTTRWSIILPSLFTFYLTTFWIVGCADPISAEEELYTRRVFEDVKTITTRYISHHSDTREKDDQVVAIASFSPDHTLDKFEQYTSYPYTAKFATPREFWISPENIEVVMDGLELGDAEKNFLYGNDWPVVYAQLSENNQHPKFTDREQLEFKSSVQYIDQVYPEKIRTERTYHLISINSKIMSDDYYEGFEYNNNKITRYYTSARLESTETIDDVQFIYAGNLLQAVQKGNKTHKFHYADNLLTKSEFYVNGKLYNYRKYEYNDKNLKVRSEIYNMYNEPEYTITYEYEFY